ncbi:MAG: hypothetical protein LCH32_13855 [Bacteroidetes bacterium]|nr:hypothetical protein [Bacteroidota bacterium]
MKILHKILILLLVIIFYGCKKYPENTIWFKKKKNIDIFLGSYRLTGYKVNGIDSLDALNYYIDTNLTSMKIGDLRFQDNSVERESKGYKYSISIVYRIKSTGFGSSYSYIYNYSRNRKCVDFKYNFYWDKTAYPMLIKKDIFINEAPWEIIRLELGKITKLKKIVNNLTYEIQFEPK